MKRFVDVGDARARIHADNKLQHEICSALESLADGLPSSLDSDLASRLPDILISSWSEHVDFQGNVIIPILKRHNVTSQSLTLQIERLELEHDMIGALGHEIAEQLELSLEGVEPNAEMIGYMLRGAFQDRRSHLEWERHFFETMLPCILAPVDQDLFSNWLKTHGWPRSLSNCIE